MAWNTRCSARLVYGSFLQVSLATKISNTELKYDLALTKKKLETLIRVNVLTSKKGRSDVLCRVVFGSDRSELSVSVLCHGVGLFSFTRSRAAVLFSC